MLAALFPLNKVIAIFVKNSIDSSYLSVCFNIKVFVLQGSLYFFAYLFNVNFYEFTLQDKNFNKCTER